MEIILLLLNYVKRYGYFKIKWKITKQSEKLYNMDVL